MTSKDLSIFSSLKPFSIGFDDMFDQFESMLGNGGMVQSNYPPYNIRKAGKDKYAIEVAVAGFNKDDVEVEFEDENGELKKEKYSNLEARVFLHEYDHMEGLDFTSHVSKLKLDMAIKRRNKQRKKAARLRNQLNKAV